MFHEVEFEVRLLGYAESKYTDRTAGEYMSIRSPTPMVGVLGRLTLRVSFIAVLSPSGNNLKHRCSLL